VAGRNRDIPEGPVFRSVAKGGRLGTRQLTDKSVCDIVKAYTGKLGLKASDFGAHSLRAGFLTSAARRGASVFIAVDELDGPDSSAMA
jgi:hypothetical protein